MSWSRVGGASPVGLGAGPMTTMPALLVAGSASSSFFMASWSAVRNCSSSVRACTLSTVCPGSAASARSVMRRLVFVTCCRSASGPAAPSVSLVAPVSPVSPAIRPANATNCRATWSVRRWARAGVSAVPEILMMLPSVAFALTSSRSSVRLTSGRRSAAAARSTTVELVAISAWVSSSRSSHCPGSSTEADAV